MFLKNQITPETEKRDNTAIPLSNDSSHSTISPQRGHKSDGPPQLTNTNADISEHQLALYIKTIYSNSNNCTNT